FPIPPPGFMGLVRDGSNTFMSEYQLRGKALLTKKSYFPSLRPIPNGLRKANKIRGWNWERISR
ncbi:MAG: hypothetical protein M1292_05505, partial [Bacteroidetes bacterium]|nr:hypothetical protein [Bacteroidota bacterium]